MAQYSAVNARANQTANAPFQTYGGQFVAPVNAEQSAGITGTNVAANEAQPFYGAATGVIGSAQSAVNPVNTAAENQTAASSAPLTGTQIDQYLSPYLGTVLNSTEQLQNISNQQQQAGQLGDAIRSGAFGSDRTGIAAANLEQQQNLANANIISGIANQGYQSALGTAQGQQQIGLAGAQQEANIGQTAYGEGANTATTLAGIGSGAQSAGLAGAQAQIGAGTVQQQTQQAQDTAKYNQFLQQQSYPFQVDQFLADIAEGTGSLSGSTTTTTQPGGFFSDRRLKRDIKKIGETYDGQDIVSYKMGDDNRTRIGLIAQDVEKKHPDAVGLAGGFKMVDYGKATQDAANKGHFYTGGVVPFPRVHRQYGGGLAGVLEAQRQMYSGMPTQQQRQISYGGGGNHTLAVAQAPAAPPPSGASEVSQTMGLVNNAHKLYTDFATKPAPTGGVTGGGSAPAMSAAGLQPSGATTFAAPSDAVATAAPASGEVAPLTSTSAPLTVAPAASAAPSAASGLAGGAASGAAGAGAGAAGSAAAGAAGAGAGAAGGAAAGAGAGAALGAAGGAAAGAAGTAAVGAGTTAAAEAAAAIAAEYAAADVGTAAVMMAKRGGRIERQSGGAMPYGGNGLPYSGAGGIDIPNQPNQHALKAAPAAAKQPTGFQTALYMGNPNDASTLMGSMFSNTAFAAGGVAGRRKFDDGGGAGGETDQNQDTAPQDTQASASPPSDGGGLAGFWDRNKGIIIPALEGVGAALTAPTSHAGVAIAAGLEAAAKGYIPTQIGLAKAEREQALARAAELENVPLGVRARIAQTVPIPETGGVSGVPTEQPTGLAPPPVVPRESAPAAPVGEPGIASPAPGASSPAPQPTPLDKMTAAQLDNYYRNQIVTPTGGRGYFVNTAGTPAQIAAIQAGKEQDWALGQGTTFNQDNARLAMERQIHTELLTNENAAQAQADRFYQQYVSPTSTPAQKAIALANYNALRQWTGDKTTLSGGIVRNARTMLPEIGTMAEQGLTPEQAAGIQIRESEPVDTGAPARQPLSQWAATHGIALPAPAVGAQAPSTVAPASAEPLAANAGVPSSGTAPAAPNSSEFAGAPKAPAWVNNPNVVPPAGQDPRAYAAVYNDLVAEAGGVQSTQQDIINTDRMLHELANSKTGPGMAEMSQIQTVLGNMTGSQFVSMLGSNPAAYAMLQKGLGQQALNDRIQEQRTAGATVRMGAQTDNLILNYLSASPEMPKAAAEGILKWKLQQDQWELGRQNAIPSYLKQGYDARFFNNIYPNTRPLSGVLTTTPPPGTTVPHRPAEITSQAQYNALPKGASYLWNGRTLVKH